MEERRTTVVTTGNGSSNAVAIVAIVVLVLIVLVGLFWFGSTAVRSLLPSRIDINVNQPSVQQPANQQPAPPKLPAATVKPSSQVLELAPLA